MNLKLLIVINNNEKKLDRLIENFKLPFNTIMHGEGTASQGILDFLGLVKTEKNILLSIIPDALEEKINKYLREVIKIQKIGKGVAFVVPISSSPKYILEEFKEMEKKDVQEKSLYHLVVSIVSEGNAEKVMNVAKKAGANGGTLIKGRNLGGESSFRFFNMTVEPEKDIVLIVCKDDDKKKIMQSILDKVGMNTDAKGICFALPVDSTIGIDE